jgi:hypothetical protein
MYARAYADHGLTWLGVAEAIGLTYTEAGVPWLAPVGPIDRDGTRLKRIRDASRAELRRRLDREPTFPELAAEVVKEYRKGETAVEAVLQEMKRMVRDAKRYEHSLLGMHELTGRLPLPPSR